MPTCQCPNVNIFYLRVFIVKLLKGEQYSAPIAGGVKQYVPKENTKIERHCPVNHKDDMISPYNQVVMDISQEGSVGQ